MYRMLLAVAVVVVASTTVQAQCAGGRCGVATVPRYVQAPVANRPPAMYYQGTVTTTATCSDPATFVQWLNGERARYGLPRLAWDSGLAADAHQNNLFQAARGLGHFFMGRARRQNAAMCQTYGTAAQMWLTSPGHRAALLAPNISRCAVSQYGQWFTFSAY